MRYDNENNKYVALSKKKHIKKNNRRFYNEK